VISGSIVRRCVETSVDTRRLVVLRESVFLKGFTQWTE
jgi:hypothetical protein